ncbi:MAG: hypothetical protein GY856_15405, partial [bacterium]|nr:hypothetical protein [bacterium]
KDRCPGSKVFAASGKDRAAILPGGRRADAAFWYDDEDGYFKILPKSWEPPEDLAGFFGKNDPDDPEGRRQRADRYFGEVWEALPEVDGEGPSYGIEKLDTGLIDRYLPHSLGGANSGPTEGFYMAIYRSPFLDSYLAELAKALIEGEALGQDAKPDLLALSFSALDMVGHRYGPDSPEFLDTLLKLDRTLDDLLDFVDEKIGLDNVLVSLTGDHGVMSVPEVLGARGFEARRLDTAEIRCIQRVAAKLQKELGSEQPLLLSGFLIDEDAARAAGVSKE